MNNTKFLRGVGIGVAVGAALSMAVAPKAHFAKRTTAGKAIKAVTEVMDNIADAMGL